MAADRTYIKGIFADQKNGPYGEFWSMWIPNVEEYIAELRKIPTDSKGGLNLTFSPRKSNPTKGSIFVNDYEPQQQGGGSSTPQQQSKPAPVEDDGGDDLPF